MDRYATYTLQDFINDDDFVLWVKQPNENRSSWWSEVKRKHPSQEPVIEKASLLVLELAKFYPEVSDIQIEKTKQAILQQQSGAEIPQYRRKWYYMYAAAASILVIIGLGIWFVQSKNNAFTKGFISSRSSAQIFENNNNTFQAIRLQDHSIVTLSPGSSIRYEMQGSESRKISLKGDAFFHVTKDSTRPFYVFSNGLTTKVLGTRFKVSAYNQSEGVKVEVSSGKVKVFREDDIKGDVEPAGIILTPNQSAIYLAKDVELIKSVVEKPRVLVSPQKLKTYTYVNTPISQIFKGLEEIYGIKVVYDKEKFKDCKLNMTLSDESLFEKLELIGKVVEARYNVLDGQVVIIGEGCSEQ